MGRAVGACVGVDGPVEAKTVADYVDCGEGHGKGRTDTPTSGAGKKFLGGFDDEMKP